MISGTEPLIKSDIWATIYPQKSIDIFKGNKQENTVNLIGILAVIGKSKTTDIAQFIYSHRFRDSSEPSYPIPTTDRSNSQSSITHLAYLTNNFHRLLEGREVYTHSRKKIFGKDGKPKRYPNPLDFGYVIITDKSKNKKGRFIPNYFLTLKGFFLIVGYDLNQSELKSIIENASKISLFFCFIKTVMDNSSIDFVTEIFIKPIQKVLLRSDIFQGGSMDFYFGNFADAISESLLNKMTTIYDNMKQSILNKPASYFSEKITPEFMQLHSTRSFTELIEIKKRDELKDMDDIIHHFRMEGIESLMNNVFYSSNPREDWYDSLFDYFYPSEESSLLFLKFGCDEKYLMNRVMQSISNTFAYFDYGVLNYTPTKLPRSKALKRHQKYKKPDKAFFKKYGSKFKPPEEFDLSNLD